MKFLAAILLVVATVHANSLHYYGWAPGKESVYRYESQVLSGIPEIRESHKTGIKLTANVRVQSFSDYSLRIKLENAEYITLNGEVKTTETGRIIKDGGSESGKAGHLPEEYKKFLEQPFLVHWKSGVVENFLVSQEEPTSVTNIKKSVLSQLQLDISGSRRSQIESNHIQLPITEEGEVSEHISYFTTSEESVMGECLTSYNVHRLPQWRINELEENWNMEERKLMGKEYQPSDHMNLEVTEGKRYCEGKPYYMITRTKDFDQCKIRPVFQKWTGIKGNCDVTKSNCRSMINHVSTVTTFVCGELNEFYIRKVSAKNIIEASPMGWETEEKVISASQVNLELLKIKSISERLPIPSNTKEIKSLIYAYPQQRNGEVLSAPEEIIRKTEAVLGIRPVLPQPGLEEAPKSLIPVELPKSEIVPQILEQMKKISREIYESPESCSSKSDIAGILSTVAKYMRHLSLSELKELEQQIKQNDQTEHKTLQNIFYDTLSLVGTNPSTMLVIRKVENGELPTPRLVKMLSYTLKSVRYPTKELLRELVKMVKTENVQSNKQLLAIALPHLSNLFYYAYINPSTMVSAYPVRLYGLFGTKESTILTEEYIPFLVEQLEKNEHEGVRLVAVSSIGKLGHIKVLQPLLEISQGKYGKEPMKRSIAVYSMKRLAKRHPSEVRPVLMSIINNPVEVAEVRIAAVAVLPWTQPTTSDLQKITIRSWSEPSNQVASFIYSTLKSLAVNEIPELRSVGIKAKSVLPLMKPQTYGVQFSHNINFSKFIEYLRTTVSQQFTLVNSKDSLIPVKASIRTDYYGTSGITQVTGLTYAIYTQGMDTLLERGLNLVERVNKASSSVREELVKIAEELRLKTRQIQPPRVFMQKAFNGIESSLYLDSEIVIEAFEKMTEKLESERSLEFSYVSAVQAYEASALGMSETGFPSVFTASMPVVYAVKGYLRTEPIEGKLLPKVSFKVIPVFNGKVQAAIGIISPFTQEVLATAIEMSLHSSIPIEGESKITRGEFELTLKTPSEIERASRETETLHVFVLPFTVRKNLLSVKPLSRFPTLKKITTGIERQPIDMPIGESLGLSGRLLFKSDAKFISLNSYIEKLMQTTPVTLLPIVLVPSSLRESSTQVKYHPAQSQTKEFHIRIRLTSKGPMHPLSSGPINEQELEGNGFAAVKEILAKLEGPASSATVVELMASRRGPSYTKTVKSAIIVGKKVEEDKIVKTYTAANVKLFEGPVYGFRYEGRVEFPEIKYLWSLNELINLPLTLKYEGKLSYGSEQTPSGEILLEAEMEKTQEQIEAVKRSPEYVKCQHEESQGRRLATECMVSRQQAASLDKVKITLKTPQAIYRSPVVTLAGDLLRSLVIGQVYEYQEPTPNSGERDVLELKIKVDRTSEVAQVKVDTPYRKLEMKNVRVLGWTKSLMPLPVINRLPTTLLQWASGHHIPATCRVEPNFVGTFDNKTLEYTVNDCYHVLMIDASRKMPLAVLARTVEGKKMVKVLSGETIVKFLPQGGDLLKVEYNGQPLEMREGQTIYKKSPSGKIIAEFKRYHDKVFKVYVPAQGLVVVTDGQRVEVVAPQMLKSRSIGLCGVLNGETTAELETPRKCIMRPKIAALSFLLNESGSSSSPFPKCEGIPEKYRSEFKREQEECTKEHPVFSPLLALYKRIRTLIKPTVRAHIVDKQRNQVCISKQMMKVCTAQSYHEEVSRVQEAGARYMSRPESLKPKTVEFVCVQRPSSLAQSLERRALAGEPLYLELEQLQVAFRKVEFEPVVCSKPVLERFQVHQELESEPHY